MLGCYDVHAVFGASESHIEEAAFFCVVDAVVALGDGEVRRVRLVRTDDIVLVRLLVRVVNLVEI